MRASRFSLFTTRETPADAEIISHQLMLRAGLIRRLGAGLYTWLPLGLRVLQRVERVVREEMDRIGALEIVMPAVQPGELWQESGRWDRFGPELLRFQDRHERDFCFGPTHEEVITDIVRREIHSYKQLPVTYYQIQTKFRDEVRPRFGVMRAREFVMKDAYSFNLDAASLQASYEDMRLAYTRIFERLGLGFRAVRADSGAIGGSVSEEFHILADSGEDEVASCTRCDYAANVELATSQAAADEANLEALAEQETPAIETVEQQAQMLGLPTSRIVKSLVLIADEQPLVVFIAGDDELNTLKLERYLGAEQLRLAEQAEAEQATGAPRGFIGPKGLPDELRVIVDARAATIRNYSSGTNRADSHWINLNWGRDVALPEVADLRTAKAGEPCPSCAAELRLDRGIEVGHIFQLGTKYSEAMGAKVLSESGTQVPIRMGCYGIGTTRIVASAIEQNHDARGIIWPGPLAPFGVGLISINAHRSPAVQELAEQLYTALGEAGMEPFWDDRNERAGVKFADMELIGIPHRVVISERGIQAGSLEYRGRRDEENQAVPVDSVVEFLHRRLGET